MDNLFHERRKNETNIRREYRRSVNARDDVLGKKETTVE
jgi:hypothetical protein